MENTKTTKVTKKDRFAELMTIVKNSNIENKNDMLAFINHEIELLNKKSSSSKETKTQKENKETISTIKKVMAEVNEPMTVTDIMAHIPLSNQKITALLKQMISTDTVVRTEVKGKAYFSLA